MKTTLISPQNWGTNLSSRKRLIRHSSNHTQNHPLSTRRMVLGIVSDQNIQRFLCVLGAPQLIREESKKIWITRPLHIRKSKLKWTVQEIKKNLCCVCMSPLRKFTPGNVQQVANICPWHSSSSVVQDELQINQNDWSSCRLDKENMLWSSEMNECKPAASWLGWAAD